MAFISLSSQNEKFSWIIEKNPDTQRQSGVPLTRNSKSYQNFLWFENDNNISLFAKELVGNPKNSKKAKSQLDFTENTKGEVYLQLIDNLLRTALIKPNEFDNVPAALKFNLYNRSGLDYSERLPDVVKSCVTTHLHSEIIIEAPTVKKALETCAVISLINSFYEEDYYIEDIQYLKYLKFAVELTDEYSLLRQMISYIRSPKLFEQAAPMLLNTPFDIKMPRAFGARLNLYREQLVEKTKNKELLELGCGEGKYLKQHVKQYTTVTSIEPEEEAYIDATHACRKIQAEDKITIIQTDAMSHLNTLDSLEGIDVLMTEVLEHIAYKDSLDIIDKVLDLGADKFLLTLPNFEFNDYYGYKPGEFRHDDHLWEPTISDFKKIMQLVIAKYRHYKVEDFYIGDSLRENPEICASFALLITKS